MPLARKVAFLSTPSAYPERPRRVDTRETHMSWVFLTDTHAFKLKKPVTRSFLDFGTLDARRHFCEEEIRLNRRLAPDVYLGTVALTCDAQGSLSIDGQGKPVDWLVKMRRLPEALTLKSAILASRVKRRDIESLAATLALFYRDAVREPVTPEAYRHGFGDIIAENRTVLLGPRYAMAEDDVIRTASTQQRFVERHGEMLEARARAGRIVEGHGDLRPEHVYLGDPPVVTDCLEFNRHFRIADPADELAYLAMECDFLGAPQIGSWLFATYDERAKDWPGEPLKLFYGSVRASLRAKISVWHLDDAPGTDHEKWRRQARQYMTLASRYVDRAFAEVTSGPGSPSIR